MQVSLLFSALCKASLLFSVLHAKCPYHEVFYYTCKVPLLVSAFYAKLMTRACVAGYASELPPVGCPTPLYVIDAPLIYTPTNT